ncbi:MAG: hypothetical protein ACYS47_13220 [Planctomycetota bacterium]|jgi:hypothetical protein
MLICFKCEIEVADGSAQCPECGGPVEEVSAEDYEVVEEETAGEEEEEAVEEGAEEEPPPPVEEEPAPFEAAPETSPEPPLPDAEELFPPVGEDPVSPLDGESVSPVEETPYAPPEEEAAPGLEGEPFPPPEEAPAFSEEAPAYSEEAPAYSEEAPAYSEEAPAFSEKAPAYSEEAPAYSEEAPAFGEEAPAFGEEAPPADLGEPGPPPEEEPAEEKKEKKGKAPKRRTGRLDRKDKKDKKSARERKKERPPRPRKSVRLEQRRLPVLLGALITLLVSAYFGADFVGSILYQPIHFLQAGLCLWGLISVLFLLGHGRWGRAGAFILGFISLAAGVFFMLKFKQENFVFMLAMLSYIVTVFVTMTGKGWFFRTLAGLILLPVVVALCAASLALDFIPSFFILNPGNEALTAANNLVDEGSKDPDTIQAPLTEALAEIGEIHGYWNHVPWDELGPVQYQLFNFLGHKRILHLYNTPFKLNMGLYRHAWKYRAREEEVELKGTEPVALAHTGVDPETLTVETDDGQECLSGRDFDVEFGSRFTPTTLRRAASSQILLDPGKVKVKYRSINHDKFTHLEDAMPFSEKVLGLLTVGGGLSALGEAIGSQYGKAEGTKYDLEVTEAKFGLDLLRNLLALEVYYFEGKASRLIAQIEQGLKAEPPDTAKVNAAAEEAKKLMERLERDSDGDSKNDDGLFFLLGWMKDKLDPPDVPDKMARSLLGRQEFNLLFFTAARLYNALNDTTSDAYSGEGKEYLELALQLEFDAWKNVTALDDPTEMGVRRQIGTIMERTNDYNQTKRWKEVLLLMAVLNRKRREVAEIDGDGPTREKVDLLEWTPAENSLGIPQKNTTIECVTFAGVKVPMVFEILDRDGIMEGKRYPTVKDFKLTREGFSGQLYCHDAPVTGLRIILQECKVLKATGGVFKEFDRPTPPAKDSYDVEAGQWIAPFEWLAELDTLEGDVTEDMKVVVTLRVLEIE